MLFYKLINAVKFIFTKEYWKNVSVSTKILSSTTVFKIENNIERYLSTKYY